MSPAEAGIEGMVSPNETPDKRVGVLIQVYNTTRRKLKNQMSLRIGQCIMTCPTTVAFDALPDAKRRLKVGRSLRLFGDGFQNKDVIAGRKVWNIPVMEGKFIVEDSFGILKAVASGNFLIFAEEQMVGLKAAEEAVKFINQKVQGVIMPFPGGICRSGSKMGSIKYKLTASTNHPFCPTLRDFVSNSQVPKNVNSIYEIVIDGLDLGSVKKAMIEGIKASTNVLGVSKISAGTMIFIKRTLKN